jgi:Condensation domain
MDDRVSTDSTSAQARTQSARERLLALMLAAEREGLHATRAVTRADRSGRPIRASHAQERLWLLDQLDRAGLSYNMPMWLRLSGELDESALERAFTELIHRHESLRTRFGSQDGVPYQLIDKAGVFKLQRLDLTAVSDPPEREQRLRERMRSEQLHRLRSSTWRRAIARCS